MTKCWPDSTAKDVSWKPIERLLLKLTAVISFGHVVIVRLS